MEINFRHDHKCFNFRVAAVIKKEDKILISNLNHYHTLPGGRVKFGETTEKAIIRSVKEELDIEIKIEKLLSINENFFDYGDDDYHELLFVYLCEPIDDVNFENIDQSQHSYERFRYIHFKEIFDLNFKPEFLLTDLKKLPDFITHNVNK